MYMGTRPASLLLFIGFAIAVSRNTTVHPGLVVRLAEVDQEDWDLNWLLTDVALKIRKNVNCLLIITDRLYYGLLQNKFFHIFKRTPIFQVLIKDYEDMLSPNYKSLAVIKEARSKGCNAYIILIANGDQVARFLRLGDRHRILDTRAQYVILHDRRLFTKDVIYLWKKIVSILFIRKYADSLRYELSTVPYPASTDNVKPRRIDSWKAGKFQKNINLFWDKTANLRGELLRVATFEHMPSVVKNMESEITEDDYMVIGTEGNPMKYEGLEIQILKSISDAMNFEVTVYEPANSDVEAWGTRQLNGSFSGLYGEVTTGKADLVLGNFHYSPYNLQLMDLSRPYTTMCFTFLTPESTTDNSWKTLIAPFRLYMWIAILVSLVFTSLIFYGLARFQIHFKGSNTPAAQSNSFWKDILVLWHHKKQTNMLKPRKSYPTVEVDNSGFTEGLYLFSAIDDSIMSTYSMLLLVSLPKMPTGWSLRMMTGWWYLYCLLVTVTYRASMTAILARPAQRVTIDTLDELAASTIGCGGWGEQNKELFTTSLDSAGQRVGNKFEVIYDTNAAIAKVAAGDYAYYENVFFLHHAKAKEKLAEAAQKDNATESQDEDLSLSQDLHIMGNCAINIPVSLGLEKNSPLKPRVDVFLQRVIEAGLVKKWLRDVMVPTTVAEAPLSKVEVKALMDLKKFQGALIALGCGLFVASLVLMGENIYWHRYVKRSPFFDKYFTGKAGKIQ